MTQRYDGSFARNFNLSWRDARPMILLASAAFALAAVLPHKQDQDPIGSVETPVAAQLKQLLAPTHPDMHGLKVDGTNYSVLKTAKVAGATVLKSCTGELRMTGGIVSTKPSAEICTEAVPSAR